MSMTARRLPEVGAWRSKLAQAVLGQRRVDLDLVVVPGRRPGEGLDARGIAIGRQLAVTTLRGHCVRPGPGLAGL
jgi:hypothetical protein